MELRGLGKHSVEVLRQIWVEFTMHPTLAKKAPGAAIESSTIEAVFGGLPHGSALIRYCHSRGWTKLTDMLDFSFDSTEVKGLGPTSMENLRRVFLKAISEEAGTNAMVFPNTIAEQNLALPITILKLLGADGAVIDAVRDEGAETIQFLVEHGITRSQYIHLKDAIEQLNAPLTDYFCRAYAAAAGGRSL